MTGPALRISWIAGLALLATGCATVDSKKLQDASASVRKVDIGKAPELKELAEHARQYGNKMYPRVCALLLDESAKPPRQFDVIFKPLKFAAGEAHVGTRRIYIDSDERTRTIKSRDFFDKVFVHEMAHLAAQSRHLISSHWNSDTPASVYWGESIADYASYKLIGTNRWGCPECDSMDPHYTSGYGCGCAFLLFVEATHGTNFVRQLTAELRRRDFSDQFFIKTTGESLAQLWSEFQATPAFKPGAADAIRIQQALGFKQGRPPRDAVARFNRYVGQHTDPSVKAALELRYDPRDPPPVGVLIGIYLYNTQPGGPPERALNELYDRGGLPGFGKGEKGFPYAPANNDELVVRSFPKTKTIKFHKDGDSSVYHYTMSRTSLASEWKLEKAWRTGPDGKVIEEFPVP